MFMVNRSAVRLFGAPSNLVGVAYQFINGLRCPRAKANDEESKVVGAHSQLLAAAKIESRRRTGRFIARPGTCRVNILSVVLLRHGK
jgi:hypothetical protein